MKYSVIIPCYTPTEADFRKCLDYIKNQTMQPYEVIVVDDASPTSVPQIAKEYGYKYIRHDVNKNNGGARNTGIRAATGDYLIFCNADDYFELDTIEQIDKVNKGQDLIILGFRTFGVDKHTVFVPSKDNTPNISQFNWNGEPMHVVNRKFLLDNDLFQIENVPIADKDWTIRLENKIKTFTFVPKACYNYQTGHASSLMQQIGEKKVVNNLTNPEYYENLNSNIELMIYEHFIPDVGGHVTALINFLKHMCKYYNITVLCKECVPSRIKEIRHYAKYIKYTGQALSTDILIYNSSWGGYPDSITYKHEPIQMLHANYKEVYKMCGFRYTIPTVPTKHVAVSKHVDETFEDMYGIKSQVIYNMLDPDVKVEKVLRLITCSRLTKEKGLDNIVKMAEMLTKFKKKFVWFIYGNGDMPPEIKKYPNIIMMGVSHDLPSYTADSDYLVHLSYTEGDPYSTKEALQVNTPCITTAYPATFEQIEDGKNGYILDFDLFKKGTDEEWEAVINKIYNKIPKFKYVDKDPDIEQEWIKLLGEPVGKKTDVVYEEVKYKVRALKDFHDIEGGILRKPLSVYKESGDNTWIVDEDRYETLISGKYVEVVEKL